jgi:hypothetical protein
MGDKTAVPRAELVALLGLSPETGDDELQRELADKLAAIKAAKVDAAEQRARAEDRGLVLAAHNDGRVHRDRVEFWCDALRRDRDANRAVLAALAPGPRPSRPLPVDADMERVHARIMKGVTKTASTASGVQAAAANPAPRDDIGAPIPPMPAPVRISRGKAPGDWTYEERARYLLHKLGPRFSQGVPPPPPGDRYYIPSPTDPYEWVENADGTGGEFRAKRRYQAGY